MNQQTAEVLLITRNSGLERLAAELWDDGIPAQVATGAGDVERYLEFAVNCIAVLDGELPAEEALQLFDILHRREPSIPTLLLGPRDHYWTFMLDRHRAQSDEFVAMPVRQLEELVMRVKAFIMRSGFDLPALDQRGAGPAGTTAVGLRHGKVVALFAVKGGVGKSTIATNLGVGLVQLGMRTLLLDADLRFGDVAIQLNLIPNAAINQLWMQASTQPTALLRGISQHSSGLFVLARPPDPTVVERIDAGSLGRVTQLMRQQFDYVVVDTHASFDDINLEVLDAADLILVVTTPDVSSISNTAGFLGLANTLGYAEKLRLVVNRSNSGISLDKIERELGMPVLCTVVSGGRWVVESGNRGLPVVLQDTKRQKEATQNFWRIVEAILEPPPPVETRRSGRGSRNSEPS